MLVWIGLNSTLQNKSVYFVQDVVVAVDGGGIHVPSKQILFAGHGVVAEQYVSAATAPAAGIAWSIGA